VNSLSRLVEALQVLPGVGPKSAQRMTLSLLRRQRDGAATLSQALADALDQVQECSLCRDLTDNPVCDQCLDESRSDGQLCVVESPADIWVIERAGGFHGRYFVLHGHLSPIDGIGPDELGLDRLQDRVQVLSPDEVILATNPTVEGETTAHYISNLLGGRVPRVSRIAHGVPLGGELEFVDGGTIVHALEGRRDFG
jgi:recombination protein RecR